MYKLIKSVFLNIPSNTIERLIDGASIPFDPANNDYLEFKKAIIDGAELQDADGNVMGAEAAKEFVRGLP